jgi:hypothetical protein
MEIFLISIGEDIVQKRNNSARSSIIEEIHNYRLLITKYSDRLKTPTLSSLDFWKTYEKTLPRLSKMAKQLVNTPATSVASESAFSTSAYVGRKERSRLSIENLASTVFLKVSYPKKSELFKKNLRFTNKNFTRK